MNAGARAAIVLAAAWVAPCRGQQADPQPDPARATAPPSITAKELLVKVGATYEGCSTYRDTGTMSESFVSGKWDNYSFQTSFQRPGRLRLECTEESGPKKGVGVVFWSGEGLTSAWASEAEGASELDTATWARLLSSRLESRRRAIPPIPALLLPDRIPHPPIADVIVRTEPELDLDEDTGIRCWRIALGTSDESTFAWIDAERFVFVRINVTSKGQNGDYASFTTYSPILNEPIPDDALRLSPPKEGSWLRENRREERSGTWSIRLLLLSTAIGGLTLAWLGWRAWQEQRPIVLPTRWLLTLALLAVATEPGGRMLADLEAWADGGTVEFDPSATVITLGLVAIAFLAQRSHFAGYTVFGVDRDVARRALVATLRTLGHAYDVNSERFRLKKGGAEVRISEPGQFGTIRISVRRMRDGPILREIVAKMRACFGSETVALSRARCFRWIGSGLGLTTLCAIAAGMLWN